MEVVQYLIETLDFEVDIPDNFGYTPLHMACESGFEDLAKYLISKGADVSSIDTLVRERVPRSFKLC